MMDRDDAWPVPSDAAATLIRDVCTTGLAQAPRIADRLDEVVEEAAPAHMGDDDDSLLALMRASNRSNLVHWVAANIDRPGERVPANIGPDTVDVARDIARRGFDDAVLQSYRRGQAVAWEFVMELVFAATDDLPLLREVLDLAARSIFTFVDDTVSGIQEQVADVRRDLVGGGRERRLTTVRLLLDGAPVTVADAARDLRYDLAGQHTAAILWAEEPTRDLELVATRTAQAAGARGPLIVESTVQSTWVWFPVDRRALDDAWHQSAAVRIAVGTTRVGADGFRRSHLDAQTTRRLMRADERLATHDDVAIAAMAGATTDEGRLRATDFVRQVLGPLAEADPQLRTTVATWLDEGTNVTATARRLFLHRNSVMRRLEQADELLPRPLEATHLEVGVALRLHARLVAG